jgi:CAAX amino terminal protease family.
MWSSWSELKNSMNQQSHSNRLSFLSALWLWLEMAVIFVGGPLLYLFNLLPGHKSIPLLGVFTVGLIYLVANKNFSKKKLGFNGFREWKELLLKSLLVAIVLITITVIFEPQNLFILPHTNPLLWGLIIIFYPIWSALTQELIYRPFFFSRYQRIIGSRRAILLLNALLFAFLHIIFRNWIAIVGAFIAGLFWARNYQKNQSWLAVTLEHAIWGNLLYTIGLGHYFYVPDF